MFRVWFSVESLFVRAFVYWAISMAQSASLYQDHILQAVLQGNLTSVPDPPARTLKLVLSSTKTGK